MLCYRFLSEDEFHAFFIEWIQRSVHVRHSLENGVQPVDDIILGVAQGDTCPEAAFDLV